MKGRARLELPSTWLKRCSRAKTELVTADEVLQQGSIEVDPFTTNQYVLVSLRIDSVIVLEGFFWEGGVVVFFTLCFVPALLLSGCARE